MNHAWKNLYGHLVYVPWFDWLRGLMKEVVEGMAVVMGAVVVVEGLKKWVEKKVEVAVAGY